MVMIWKISVLVLLAGVATSCSSGGNDPRRPLQERTLIILNDRSGDEAPLFVIRNGVGERFGAARDFREIALSPDGTHLATINAIIRDGERDPEKNELRITDLGTNKEVLIFLRRTSGLQWALNSSAIAVLGQELVLVSRSGELLARRAARGDNTGFRSFFGWSADSSKYAVRNGDSIEIVEVQSGATRAADLRTLTADYGTPSPSLALAYWVRDGRLFMFEVPKEHVGTENPQLFLVDESLDPSSVRALEGTENIPVPVFVSFEGSADDVRATSTALSADLPDVELDSFGVSTDWRAQLFRRQNRRSEMYVQDLSTGEWFKLDMPEIDGVAGSEFMSVYVAPE